MLGSKQCSDFEEGMSMLEIRKFVSKQCSDFEAKDKHYPAMISSADSNFRIETAQLLRITDRHAEGKISKS